METIHAEDTRIRRKVSKSKTNPATADLVTRIMRRNAILPNSSLLARGRDERKTTKRYKETNDLELVDAANGRGYFIIQHKQVMPHDSDRFDLAPYMAVYINFINDLVIGGWKACTHANQFT